MFGGKEIFKGFNTQIDRPSKINRRSIDMTSVQPWDMPQVEGECVFCHIKTDINVVDWMCIPCEEEYDRQAKNYLQRQANQYPRFGQEE